MVSEREHLERKFAKELLNFAKRWDTRMAKACMFPEGSNFHQVALCGPHHARSSADIHLAQADVLKNGTAVP